MSKKSNVLDMTPEEARAFLRRVMGPPTRELTGDEYNSMMLILSLKEPVHSSDNQRFWTDTYEHNDRTYEVTYGVVDYPLISEVED